MSIAGVNYPWRRYGGDFGATVWGTTHGIRHDAAAIRADFDAIRAAGLTVVRWFVFTDARGGVAVDAEGWPTGFAPGALDDLDALLALALAAGLEVVPVLFDHTLAFAAHDAAGARLAGHAAWLGDPEGQSRVLDAVVAPLAARYGAGGPRRVLAPAIHAWDLLNEPDWIVQEFHPSPRVEVPIAFDVLGAWVREATAAFRRHDAGRLTLGNARLRFVHWWDAPGFDLDFLQAHAYYDPDHDYDLLATPHAALGVTRPVVVGECSARGDAEDPRRGRPPLPLGALTAAALAHGYAGAWPWSWTGVDAHGAPAAGDLARARAAADGTATD